MFLLIATPEQPAQGVQLKEAPDPADRRGGRFRNLTARQARREPLDAS